MTDPLLPARSTPVPSAPESGDGEQVFLSRRERRAYEQAAAQDATPASATPVAAPAKTVAHTTYAAPQYPSQALSFPGAQSAAAQQQAPALRPHVPPFEAATTVAPAALPSPAQQVTADAVPASGRPTTTPAPEPRQDSFAELLGLFDEPEQQAPHRATAVEVRERDAQRTAPVHPADRGATDRSHGPGGDDARRAPDLRRAPDAARNHQLDEIPVSTQTGRVRLRPDELARATDSAPVPIALPGPGAEASWGAPGVGVAGGASSSPRRGHRDRQGRRATPSADDRGSERGGRRSEPRTGSKREPKTEAKQVARGKRSTSTARALSTTPRRARLSLRRRSPLAKLIAKTAIMVAAAGLVATTAVPAYAQFDDPVVNSATSGKLQTLAVGSVDSGSIDSTSYSAHTLSTALDSTLGTVVAPETQALAKQLMSAVTQGRLTGSSPDHIFEIRYLAAGEAVPGCGIDYRVLQAIAFALTKFNTVGVSDINRHCTGQIEGAGTASAHYTDGGGHAVDFFLLNGHALSGGDSDSIKLIEALDGVVPAHSTVGQVNCRSGLSLEHFQQIDDTCNHVHIDFLDATGATLLD